MKDCIERKNDARVNSTICNELQYVHIHFKFDSSGLWCHTGWAKLNGATFHFCTCKQHVCAYERMLVPFLYRRKFFGSDAHFLLEEPRKI